MHKQHDYVQEELKIRFLRFFRDWMALKDDSDSYVVVILSRRFDLFCHSTRFLVVMKF